MIGSPKEVYFYLYCDKCKHRNVTESDEPCHDCLNEPSNIDSHRPVKYEPKES